MGKHSKYTRHFKTSWLSESWAKGWLKEHKTVSTFNSNDPNEAYCLYCHTTLRAHYSDLKRHATTKTHVTNAASRIVPKNLTVTHYFPTTSLSTQLKKSELKLAMYILQHCSIRSVDHLGELVKESTKEASLNIKLHRTKCSAIIRKIFGPTYLKMIVDTIGTNSYSCIIDESTDVSIIKYLAICVRYFNGTTVVTDFLGLLEVEQATADDLYNLIVTFFSKIGLSLKNMLALGTDGGANLCGKNNSVYTLLKEKSKIPNLILIKCICHAIHLCVSKASTELPTCLDFLAREVYNWFGCSPLRRIQYRKIFDLINLNENKKFKNFVKLSDTRWLARYNVLKRIYENWLELQTFFKVAGATEKCYKAKTLDNILQDKINYLYFKFLLPILEETNSLNLIFQSNNHDISAAYSQYFLAVESLARRIIKPKFLENTLANDTDNENKIGILKKIKEATENELAFLTENDADLGYVFTSELDKLNIPFTEKQETKQRCLHFLIKLLKEFVQRIPTHIDLFQNVRFLHPHICCNKLNKIEFSSLNLQIFILQGDDYYKIENQWRKLNLIDWSTEFPNDVDNMLQFWPVVYNYIDGSGQQPFIDLARTVIRFLCLPTSNAAVERVFSVMNYIKTKIRNRMKLGTLDAIIRTKIFCGNRDICCKNFKPDDHMFTLFNASIYQTETDENSETAVNSNPNTDDEVTLILEAFEHVE